MKCFVKGMAGALLVLIAAAIIAPQYSNYVASSQTSIWLIEIEPTTEAITSNILRLQTVSGSGVGIPRPVISHYTPSLIEVTDSGTVFLKGGSDGQFVALVPAFSNGVVTWRCIGGSAHATLRCSDWK